MANDQDCNTCEKLSDVTWAIKESQLGILWDSVFQRIIVYLWYLEMHNHPILGGNYPLNDEVKDEIAAWGVDIYAYPPVSPIRTVHPPTNIPISNTITGKAFLVNIMSLMLLDDTFSDPFKEHLQDLIDYFDLAYSIPVYFLEGNGYDYILSSKGIELVAPKRDGFLRFSDGNIRYENQIEEPSGGVTVLDPADYTGIIDTQEKEFLSKSLPIVSGSKGRKKTYTCSPRNYRRTRGCL